VFCFLGVFLKQELAQLSVLFLNEFEKQVPAKTEEAEHDRTASAHPHIK